LAIASKGNVSCLKSGKAGKRDWKRQSSCCGPSSTQSFLQPLAFTERRLDYGCEPPVRHQLELPNRRSHSRSKPYFATLLRVNSRAAPIWH